MDFAVPFIPASEEGDSTHLPSDSQRDRNANTENFLLAIPGAAESLDSGKRKGPRTGRGP